MLITSSHLYCLVVSLGFSIGRKAKNGEPQVIANLWAGVWCKKVWGMEALLVIDQVLAGLLRLVFAKTTWIQPILTKQVFKHFVLATTFLQVKNLPVLTAFVYESVTGQRSSWFQKNLQNQGVPMIWGSLAPNLCWKQTNNHRVQADQELGDFHLFTKVYTGFAAK